MLALLQSLFKKPVNKVEVELGLYEMPADNWWR